MLNRTKIILGLLFISLNLSAQTSIISVLPKNVADYYAHINRAELLVTDDKFSEALIVYDSAFAAFKQPFALDYYNAMQCANLAKNFDKTKVYALQLVDLGCNYNFFFKPRTLKAFRASTAYYAFINEYPTRRTAFVRKCDWKMRTKLEGIALRDQYWRSQDPNYERIRTTTYQLDDTLMVEVQQLLKKGYPSEAKIGVVI